MPRDEVRWTGHCPLDQPGDDGGGGGGGGFRDGVLSSSSSSSSPLLSPPLSDPPAAIVGRVSPIAPYVSTGGEPSSHCGAAAPPPPPIPAPPACSCARPSRARESTDDDAIDEGDGPPPADFFRGLFGMALLAAAGAGSALRPHTEALAGCSSPRCGARASLDRSTHDDDVVMSVTTESVMHCCLVSTAQNT